MICFFVCSFRAALSLFSALLSPVVVAVGIPCFCACLIIFHQALMLLSFLCTNKNLRSAKIYALLLIVVFWDCYCCWFLFFFSLRQGEKHYVKALLRLLYLNKSLIWRWCCFLLLQHHFFFCFVFRCVNVENTHMWGHVFLIYCVDLFSLCSPWHGFMTNEKSEESGNKEKRIKS